MKLRCRLFGHDWRPDRVHLFGVCRRCPAVKGEPHPFQISPGRSTTQRPGETPSQAMARLMEGFDLGPVAARLEVGKGVLPALRATIPAAAKEPRWTGPPSSALFGIPIVPCDDVPPGKWRLLDTNGHVMKSGTL